MTKKTRWVYLVATLVFAMLIFWGLTATLASPSNVSEFSSLRPDVVTKPQTAEDPTPLGEPCGSGELMSSDVLCFHGTVSILTQPGLPHLLNNVPITISDGIHNLTGTTFIHPGYTTPTYGIDIGPLNPEFLRPVTLTANISGSLVQRSIIVYPDFNTQNQRYDVQVLTTTIGALDEPARLWGHVIDFSAGGAVTNAVVIAEYNGSSVTMSTTVEYTDTLPIYAFTDFDLNAIGATTGSQITLTAYYNEDSDQHYIVLEESSTQIDFVTGWKCDGFNPLPQTSGGRGMPQTSGGRGLPQTSGGRGMPDVACFWGYGVVDGIPQPGVNVQLEISSTVYEGVTRYYPGEDLPRYGIGVWGGQVISGEMMMATAVYSGFIGNQILTVTLDTNLSQQVDTHIVAASSVLANIINSNQVNALLWHDGFLWAGTNGGVVRWDPNSGSYIQYTTVDGLATHYVAAIAAAPDGALWFGSNYHYLTRYHPKESPAWHTFQVVGGGHSTNADRSMAPIVFDADGVLWVYSQGSGSVWRCTYANELLHCDEFDESSGFAGPSAMTINTKGLWLATSSGINRCVYTDTFTCQTFTTAHGLASNTTYAIVSEPLSETLWVGTSRGLNQCKYTNTLTGCKTYTKTHGLLSNRVTDIVIESDATLWTSENEYGANYCTYDDNGMACQSFTTTHGLISNTVTSIVLDENDTPWFGTDAGISRYLPGDTPEWRDYIAPSQLPNDDIQAIARRGNEIWFGTGNGIGLYVTDNITAWQAFTSVPGIANYNVKEIFVDEDDTLWFSTEGGVSHCSFTHTLTGCETFNTTHGVAHNSVRDIVRGSDGALWLATLGGGINRYSPGSGWQTFNATNTLGLAGNKMKAVWAEPDGVFWFGDTSTGLSRCIYTSGLSCQHFTETHGLYNNYISDIMTSRDGTVWVAHWIGGIDHCLYASDTLTSCQNYSTDHGLGDNSVREIEFGADNALWLATDDGINRCVYNGDLTCELFQIEDGLINQWINAIEFGPDQTLWVGTLSGLTQFVYPMSNCDIALANHTPSAVLAGQRLTYTLRITNSGATFATTPTLSINLSPELEYISSSLSPFSTQPLTWALSTLPPHTGTLSLTVLVSVPYNISPGITLTSTAEITTTSLESFFDNNSTHTSTYVRDPYRPDIYLESHLAPLWRPGYSSTLSLVLGNLGGISAETVTLTSTLPPELDYVTADPEPTSFNPLVWQLGTMHPLSTTNIILTATVADTVPVSTKLGLNLVATSIPTDANLLNNTATLTLSTSLTDALTLILVAPERLTAHYGALALQSRLYTLAEHPNVRGAIVDVMLDQSVRDAYANWDSHPSSVQYANAVATAIKTVIDNYTINYPNLRYLVIVGGDTIIPHYRVPDQNNTMWIESRYRYQLPITPLYYALAANYMPTDDFYADRAPTIPASSFWTDGHPLYVPDFALGRLVETPDEILATIDAFLANDGEITLDSSYIGTIPGLTEDLGQAQQTTIQDDSVAVSTTLSANVFRQAALTQPFSAFWSAFHSNHSNIGALNAIDILNSTTSYSQTLFVTIGCHAGLSVPDNPNMQVSYDVAQALLRQGGTLIGPAAYAYASYIGVSYSEALAQELTEQLLVTTTQAIGPALVRAKQNYYANHAWFDYTDEKVLLPITLYGLPMLRVFTPDTRQQAPVADGSFVIHNTQQKDTSVITLSLQALTYTLQSTPNGHYFTPPSGNAIVQDGYPVQPQHTLPLAEMSGGQHPHGLVLFTAIYTNAISSTSEITTFTPLTAQSWAIGEPRKRQVQSPPLAFSGWDRTRPYALGLFNGLSETTTRAHFVLGRYDTISQKEILFTNLEFEVLYSASTDYTPPTIQRVTKQTDRISTQITDTTGITQVIATCDDEQGHWVSTVLAPAQDGVTWQGPISTTMRICYIQAIDNDGNVAYSHWSDSTPRVFLPLIHK